MAIGLYSIAATLLNGRTSAILLCAVEECASHSFLLDTRPYLKDLPSAPVQLGGLLPQNLQLDRFRERDEVVPHGGAEGPRQLPGCGRSHGLGGEKRAQGPGALHLLGGRSLRARTSAEGTASNNDSLFQLLEGPTMLDVLDQVRERARAMNEQKSGLSFLHPDVHKENRRQAPELFIQVRQIWTQQGSTVASCRRSSWG